MSDHVYNSIYKGPTYAVKYLGIVDGAMGILSRKMALGPAKDYNNDYILETKKNFSKVTSTYDKKDKSPKNVKFDRVLKSK